MVAEFRCVSDTRKRRSELALYNQCAFLRLCSTNCSEFERKRIINEIARANEGLVKFVVRRASENLPEKVDELTLVGCQGLARAINRFDPLKGKAFSSFAVPFIRGAIQQHMRDRYRMVRISQTDQEINQRINKIERIYKQQGIPISRLEIARNLHNANPCTITLEYLEELERMNAREYITSLDVEVDDGPDFQVESWYDDDESLLSDALKAALGTLKHSEYVCIRGAYWQRMSEGDIAQDYGWTVEEVRVHLECAIAKLKSELEDWA